MARVGARRAPAAGAFGHGVEDALAAVALNDFGAAQDVVEYLRTQPHVTDRADAVARFGDGDAVTALGDRLEDSEHLLVQRGDDHRALGDDPLERRFQLGVLGGHLLAVGVHGLLLRRQFRVGALRLRGQLVGFEHALEDLLFERLDLALRRR